MKQKQEVKNKKEEQDFFEQMEMYELYELNKIERIVDILGIIFLVTFFVCYILYMGKFIDNREAIFPVMIISLVLSIISAFGFLYVLFSKNSFLFRHGNIRYGIINFIIFSLLIYGVLLVGYFLGANDIKDLFKSLFVPVTTMCAAILAIIGVHYSISRQREENEYRRNLVFVLNDSKGTLIDLQCRVNSIKLSINIKNCSDNQGYLIGFYRLNGGEIYEISELPYTPILSQTNYTINNIEFNESDDQIIMIYTDINQVYYYLSFDINSRDSVQIKQNGKCDWYFFKDALEDSMDSKDKKARIEENAEATINFKEEIIDRKVNTRPILTKKVGNYDFIIDGDGKVLTDSELLDVLRKERLRVAKEQKKPAYMVFNNQQLIALATFKPTNREEFISIFSLGEGKYALYGENFINIIVNFISKISKVA